MSQMSNIMYNGVALLFESGNRMQFFVFITTPRNASMCTFYGLPKTVGIKL